MILRRTVDCAVQNTACLSHIIYTDIVLYNGSSNSSAYAGCDKRVATGKARGNEGMGATPRNQSVQKAFLLLKSFRDPDEWISNAELSRRTGLSEAGTHRLMKTLEEIGVVVKNTRGRYRPGMVLATISKDVAIGDLVRATSQDVLVDLAARLNGVVHVGVLEDGMVTYAAKMGEPICVPIPTQVGAQQEAYCCALGKILVAGLADRQLEEFLHDGKLIALTPQTITDIKKLRLEIEAVRHCGYAIDDREVFHTVCCIGVPILDPSGKTVAALSLSDTSDHMDGLWRDRVSAALIETASVITKRIYPSFGEGAHGTPLQRMRAPCIRAAVRRTSEVRAA